MKALYLRIYGRVQRVGFSRYVLDTAQKLMLSGYVNIKVLNKFLKYLQNPPYPAIVEKIKKEERKPNPEYKYFKIIFGEIGEELQEGFGAIQAIFMDY